MLHLFACRNLIPFTVMVSLKIYLPTRMELFHTFYLSFNHIAGPKLHRRVNVFLFLNDEWPEEYGGHLELWNKELNTCGQRILPSLGRFVIFSTSDFSYHGHPHPLSAPAGRVRRSLALYYYTATRPAEDCIDGLCPVYHEDGRHFEHGHSTLWKKPECSCIECFGGIDGGGVINLLLDG